MSSAQAHLNRQHGIIDGMIYDERLMKSKFFYDGYTTERPKHKEWKVVNPEVSTVTYGGTSTFVVPIHMDKMGPCVLEWDQAILSVTGGTYHRFQDWFPLAAISKIDVQFGNNLVYSFNPFKKFWRLNKHISNERRAAEAAMLAGDLSATERNTAAAAVQNILFDIPFPWTLAPDRYTEIRQLAVEPKFVVYWNNLADFVQTDGTVPVSAISNLRLNLYSIYVETPERDINSVACESDHGVVRLWEEHLFERMPTTIPSGTTGEFTFELKNVKTSVRFLAFVLRPTADVDTTLAKRTYEDTTYYGDISRFRIISGAGDEIIPWFKARFNLYEQHKLYYQGEPGSPMFFYSWDDNPQDEMNAHGSYNFANIVNPQLIIDFGSTATSEDMYCDILWSKWNFGQVVRGEWAKQFI